MKQHLISTEFASSCYFRSSVKPPYRKALIKITDWCNLHCAHCFVSAGKHGETMEFEKIKNTLLPALVKCKVISVTLTGGEPFAHPNIMEIISLFCSNDIKVSLCTNATLCSEKQIRTLSRLNGVTVNVSLDGFSENSHGKFRGDKKSFYKTIETIELFSKYKLLKGLLVTPNRLGRTEEYGELCEFAIKNDAKYVLMNPLSLFGRGIKSKDKLSSPTEMMNEIKALTSNYSKDLELVNIRFPNKELPLSSCEAGNIIYVFVNGDVTACPYLVFATENGDSQHKREEFILGNLLTDENVSEKIINYNIYKKYKIGFNGICNSCSMDSICKKGCPAAVIASGQRIEGVDFEQCPKSLIE
ncbi:radical SAM protein [Aureispira sp. CCB-QB1]|uniref:radical SAM/SPASM domain-containing protein n=1 Tax=Aureispira sp. CCB-QB1 TaxID=1313421 RepID=UPI0006984E96|nr:radical SAM protein [Aureispira sp. CCB-QB1]